MLFSDRLREERKRLGLSQEAFGQLAGVTSVSQGNYERDLRKPDVSYLEALGANGVDLTYLLTGHRVGDTVQEPTTTADWYAKPAMAIAPPPPQDIDEHEFTRLRYYGVKFSNGRGVGIADQAELKTLVFRTDFLKSLGMSENNSVAVDTTGDSNYPEIPKGQGVVLVKMLPEGQIVSGKLHAFRLGDDLFIKKLYRLDHGDLLAVPANPEHAPFTIGSDRAHEFDLIGHVRWACVTLD